MTKTKQKLYVIVMLFLGISALGFGQNTSSLSLDGVNDYVRYNDDATLGLMDGATNYTIEAWIKPNASTAEYDRVLTRYASFAIVMYDENNDGSVIDWYFQAYDDASSSIKYFNTSGDATLTANEWNHIAVINNSADGSLKLYVNGIDVTNGSYTNQTLRPSQANDNLYIGSKKASTPNNSFAGLIDEVRLKNTAETPSSLHSNTTDAPYTSDANTAALFHFDENTGTTTTNEASGTNATLNNGATWGDVAGLPLPIELSSFAAYAKRSTVNLDWTTTLEINNQGFEIQRSKDGLVWEKLGFISGAGNSNKIQHYQFIDRFPSKVNYYRLKQLDFDGKSDFSQIVSAFFAKANVSIYPNPARDVLYVNSSDDGQLVYRIFDLTGKRIDYGATNDGIIRISDLSKGLYILNLTSKTSNLSFKIQVE